MYFLFVFEYTLKAHATYKLIMNYENESLRGMFEDLQKIPFLIVVSAFLGLYFMYMTAKNMSVIFKQDLFDFALSLKDIVPKVWSKMKPKK